MVGLLFVFLFAAIYNTYAQIAPMAQMAQMSVGFSAIYNSPRLLEPGETLIFNKVITNVGGAYNPSTGIMTCPLSGLYVINVGGLSTPGNLMTLNLYHNEKYLITVHAYDERAHSSGSRTVVLECLRGETVYVVVTHPVHMYSGETNNYEHNIFSGFLISSTMENMIAPMQ